jgi:hypothetical protein
MKKRKLFLIAVAVALAAAYVFFFTNWTRPNVIQMRYVTRAGITRFGLDRDYELTELKVVPLAAWQTNKSVLPVWHLVSDSGSDDVNQFYYGKMIDGMDSAVEGARPERLQPGVTYRMFVTAGKIKGQLDFEIKPAN